MFDIWNVKQHIIYPADWYTLARYRTERTTYFIVHTWYSYFIQIVFFLITQVLYIIKKKIPIEINVIF